MPPSTFEQSLMIFIPPINVQRAENPACKKVLSQCTAGNIDHVSCFTGAIFIGIGVHFAICIKFRFLSHLLCDETISGVQK